MTVLAEKLRRLAEMSLPEIRFRAAQKLRIARERWQISHDGRRGYDSPWWHSWDHDTIPDGAFRAALRDGDESLAAQHLPRFLAEREPQLFYWHPALRQELVRAHRKLFPGRAEQIRAKAQLICEHRFRIFTYPEITCGSKIPWQRDLVSGVESALEHYARIAYLDFARVGDSKVTWELNRHQHFITLGEAYLLTGDERYPEECFLQWEDWQRENPYLRGINWASSLEVAFRSWSWLWMLHLLSGSEALTGRRIGNLTAALAQNAQFISENLSAYFSPNTHLLGEGFALFVIGLLFPELRGSEKWCERGRAILLQEMNKQVRADGSHFEQSSSYHRYAVEFFLCAAMLAKCNGCPFPPAYQNRLEQMAEFLQSASLPGGRDPMMGDSDGGRVIAFCDGDANDWSPVLSLAAHYFQRGDLLSSAKHPEESALWLLGPEAASELARLETTPPLKTSRAFPYAGLVTMRSDWTDHARVLLFDAGPQGFGMCGHGHADSLGFVCSSDGTNWLADSGTYVYTASRLWREFFRSTRAHNTVVVDGKDQARPVDWFKWRAVPEVRLERTISTSLLDYASGFHSGYLSLSQPVEHRRRVIFVKADYWILCDELLGTGTHHLDFFFHFAPGITIEPEGIGYLASRGKQRFLFLPLPSEASWRVVDGEESPIQGWYSEGYGHRQRAPVLVGSVSVLLPARFVCLLMPSPASSVRFHEQVPGGLNLTVETDAWTDFLAGNWGDPAAQAGPVSTNSELVFCRHDASGGLERLSLINGSSLVIRDRQIVHSERKLQELSVTWSEERVSVCACPPARFRLYGPTAPSTYLNGNEAAVVRADGWTEFQGEN